VGLHMRLKLHLRPDAISALGSSLMALYIKRQKWEEAVKLAEERQARSPSRLSVRL
jgi:hypothetical protein